MVQSTQEASVRLRPGLEIGDQELKTSKWRNKSWQYHLSANILVVLQERTQAMNIDEKMGRIIRR